MPPVSRTPWRLLASCAVIVLLLVVVPRSSSAQTAPTLGVSDISHQADGSTVAVLTATPEELATLSVLIDGESVPFDVTDGAAGPSARIVFMVENSVSMTLVQLADVQSQMSLLVDSLRAADRVGVVTFGGGATVALPLTTDRVAFQSAIGGIVTGGGSALYSGVGTAGEMLADDGGPALVVLFTYGWEWGGLSTHAREESAALSGASVYVQSMIFDAGYDAAYLVPLATDGIVHDVTLLSAVPGSVSLLGGAEPSRTLTFTAPALALGTHELTVTSDAGAAETVPFEVMNDGLLTLSTTSGLDAADPITVQVDTVGVAGAFEFSASIAGTELEVASDGSIAIDPWIFVGGLQSLEVTASVNGALAQAITQTVTIPTLEPVLTIDQSDQQVLVATLLAQPGTATALVAVVDGAVVAEGSAGSLEIERPDSGALTFEARLADGDVIASQQVSATAVLEPVQSSTSTDGSAGSPLWRSPAFLAIPLGLIVMALLLKARSRRRLMPGGDDDLDPGSRNDGSFEDTDNEPIELPWRERVPQPSLVPQASITAESQPEPTPEPEPEPEPIVVPTPIRATDWAVMVRLPGGETRRIEVGFEPVSIGASKLCTVSLEDDAVRFVHLVIARDGYSVKAHQFGPVAIDGNERNVEDEELLTNSVMQIGDVAIWLEPSVEESAAVDAA